MSHVPSLGYLYRYSASLSALPEETAIFVVERSIDSDRSEVEAVFLDRAAATLWIERRPAPGDLRILPFSTFRNRNSDLVYLRPGTPRPTNPLMDAARRRLVRDALSPLPRDHQ
jgi:hypothetical protein